MIFNIRTTYTVNNDGPVQSLLAKHQQKVVIQYHYDVYN